MIVGIGVDLVDIARFERSIARTPRLIERLFSSAERVLPSRSLAARYAAKEALIKALGGSDGVHWTEIEVRPEASGRPWFTLSGSTAAVVAARGITTVHLSLSHDAGLATAFVVAEGDGERSGGPLTAEARRDNTSALTDTAMPDASRDDSFVGGQEGPG